MPAYKHCMYVPGFERPTILGLDMAGKLSQQLTALLPVGFILDQAINAKAYLSG